MGGAVGGVNGALGVDPGYAHRSAYYHHRYRVIVTAIIITITTDIITNGAAEAAPFSCQKTKIGHDRHMIRRPPPVPAIAKNARTLQAGLEAFADRDTVEPAAPVRCFPIPRAVAPPAIEAFLGCYEMTDRVDPRSRFTQKIKFINFHRRMAHDL